MSDPAGTSLHDTGPAAERSAERSAGEEQTIAPAQLLGGYMVLSQIAHGDMGQVYAAYDAKLDRRVALKLLHAQSNAGDREQLMREAKALARLSHPHVVTVHEVDEFDGRPLLSMEFVEGQTLKEWSREHPVGRDKDRALEALELLVQAGQGLAAAHAEALVHRVAVPEGVEQALRRGLAIAPSARHRSLEPLLKELQCEVDMLRGRATPRPRWRAWLSLGLAALLAAGVFGAYRWNIARLTQVCAAEGDAIDEVWNASRRQALTAGLSATMLGSGMDLGGPVMPWVDQQAEAWRNQARIACINATVHAIWTSEEADKAQWCLEERRIELETLVTLLTNADEVAARNATTAVSGLRRIEPCLDPSSIARMGTPPTFESRVSMVDVRQALGRARALQATASYATGLSLTRTTQEEVKTLGSAPLIAAARAQEASLLNATGDYNAAEIAGTRAFVEASRSGAWDVAVDAATTLSNVVGVKLERHVEGVLWARLADVAIFNAGDPLGLREANRCADLASIYLSKGEYDKALEVHRRGLAILERVLRRRHPAVAVSHFEVASIYEAKGQYDEALKLQSEAITHLEETFGPKHPVTAAAYNGMGLVYWRTGQYDEALNLATRALSIAEDVLGPGHPTTAASYNNVATIHHSRGEYDDAIALYKKALSTEEKTLGVGHPETAISYSNIGTVYNLKGEYERSLEFHHKALASREQALGKWHPSIAVSLNNIGSVHRSRGQHQQALDFHFRALAIRKDSLGKSHPHTADSYGNIGLAYGSLRRYDESLVFHRKALAIRERRLGTHHISVATSFNNIAAIHAAKGEYEQALNLYHKALEVRVRVLGKKHLRTAVVHNNIGAVHYTKGRYDDALTSYHRALAIKQSIFGEKHPSIAITHVNVGNTQSKQGDFAKALRSYRRALTIYEDMLGKQHASAGRTLNAIGDLCRKKGHKPACVIAQ